MSPVCSVVIPCLDDAEMLERCLAALERQTVPADEIIVVDNGSTDGSVEAALRHGARVVHETVRGIPQATAAGFDAARGELLLRLDADSVPPRDWVARVARAFTEDPTLDVLSGPGRFYGGSGFIHWFAENVQFPLYDHVIGALLGHDVVFGSNAALRASAWRILRERVHRDRADVHDDLDLAINLAPGMNVRYDTTLLVGVSARPFLEWDRWRRGVAMAFHTMAVNGAEENFLTRRRAFIAASRAARLEGDEGFDYAAR